MACRPHICCWVYTAAAQEPEEEILVFIRARALWSE